MNVELGTYDRQLYQTSKSVDTNNIPYIREYNVNSNPFTFGTLAMAVPTASTNLFSYKFPAKVELHDIYVIGDSSVLGNGVEYYLQYGRFKFGEPDTPVGIIAPFIIPFDKGNYPVMNQGDVLSLTAQASATGSYLQILVFGSYI